MKLIRVILVGVVSVAAMAGCAKTDEGQGPAATQPAASVNAPVSPSTLPSTAEPVASSMLIDDVWQSFPPARLRLSAKDGKVIARLYSDDPKGVLTGKETVNSYDMLMALPGISDPADISGKVWVDNSASMDKKVSLYGIFLNNRQDALQPMNVMVSFEGKLPRVTVRLRGKFALFHISEQTPNPAPVLVNVLGVLDAKVLEK